jgi:hypothetical protein
MKMSLLEMVQDILNDLDSDEVNSIDDTVEAQQIAQIIKTCYFEMMANRNWPHLRQLIQLEPSGDLSKPNYLRIPSLMKQMDIFRYDVRKAPEDNVELREVAFVYPDEFLRKISNRNSSNQNIKIVTDFSGSSLLIQKDKAPEYWTTFDDQHLVTDSYNEFVDDTLKSSKTQCLAYIHPQWVRTNEAIPNLPSEAFPALLEEAKSTAFVNIKQMMNQKAEQKAARQQRWLSRKAWNLEGGVRYEDYGRKGRR